MNVKVEGEIIFSHAVGFEVVKRRHTAAVHQALLVSCVLPRFFAFSLSRALTFFR